LRFGRGESPLGGVGLGEVVVVLRELDIGVAKSEILVEGSSELSSEPAPLALAIDASHSFRLLSMSLRASPEKSQSCIRHERHSFNDSDETVVRVEKTSGFRVMPARHAL